ncbi:COP23 domain-containing protein [Nostoc sp. ChiQUE01b]|uniref:COP23 domain-containing protein n=1 Tax=Nostoc sp. ChiQUE01b TaxID=3075376 RepID=UPI002AD1E986|nr:COP23 domain-containing protein [Nostoc sp. ChiQUE01b]MDZ8260989.1 COP23 domain-containing protein [Nostoc sp. ChiQUE01b]
MRLKLFVTVLALSTVAFSYIATINYPSLAQAQTTTTYSCGKSRDGTPTTYARTETGKKIAVIRWSKNWGGEYTPESRCKEVSSRFQIASEKEVLKFITSGIMSGQPVICATSDYGAPCSQLLLTLRHGENPDEVIQKLIGVGFRAEGPLTQKQDGSIQYYYDIQKKLDLVQKNE